MHIVSDKSLQRPGYVYNEDGIGYQKDYEPFINWRHRDGPLLCTSDCSIHWLTWRERIQFFFGLTDIHALNRKHLRPSSQVRREGQP